MYVCMYAYRKQIDNFPSLNLYYELYFYFLHQKEEVLARGGSSDIADTDTDRSIPKELSAQWIGGRDYNSGDQDARYKYFFIMFKYFL